MDQRRRKRVKRRIPCELSIADTRQSGIVLDVSAQGLFVQTAVTPSPGTVVEVQLAATRTSPELIVRARVVRALRVPPGLLAVAAGGLGLRVIEAPPEFAALVVGEAPAATLPPSAAPSRGRSAERKPEPPKPESPSLRFRVRLQAIGTMRSRTVTVECRDAKAAVRKATAVVGSGWEVIDVCEQP